jgi:cytochrome c biogenesis protein
MSARNPINKLLRALSSIRTGVILLIVVVIASAIGTIVLQRPTTEPDQIERAYSPQTLLWLDRLGLTDVFHSWWFATLLALVATSIILVSIDRFPRAWRVLTRPYKSTDSHFRAVLPVQEKIAVADGAAALEVADRAFRKSSLRPERIGEGKDVSLYAERNRISVLAVYVIHASLLLIFVGGIIDAIYGYKGFVVMTKGQSISKIELSNKKIKKLPFTLRFDTGARENYSDGSPKQWWSQVTVLENGKEVAHKKIEVNEPLVRDGIRFFQSSFGMSDQIDTLKLTATTISKTAEEKDITLHGKDPAQLDAERQIQLVKFIPDYVERDGEIYARSNDPNNPAFELTVTKAGMPPETIWIFPSQPGDPRSVNGPYQFGFKGGELAPFTGLQVSHEPGQWAVWGGCVLMGFGLVLAFYCVHRRYWATIVEDPKLGTALWIGTQADKNREHYAEEFQTIVKDIRDELHLQASVNREERSLASVSAGR